MSEYTFSRKKKCSDYQLWVRKVFSWQLDLFGILGKPKFKMFGILFEQ